MGGSSGGRLTHIRVLSILKNPCYAGMYVFGRYQYQQIVGGGEIRKRMQAVARPDRRVRLEGTPRRLHWLGIVVRKTRRA